MKYIIERMEGEYAICQAEDWSVVHFPLKHLGHGIKKGECIRAKSGVYSIEPSDEYGKERIKSFLDDLFENESIYFLHGALRLLICMQKRRDGIP